MFCDELIKVKVLEGLYAKNGKPVAAVLCGPSGATLVKNGGEIAITPDNEEEILRRIHADGWKRVDLASGQVWYDEKDVPRIAIIFDWLWRMSVTLLEDEEGAYHFLEDKLEAAANMRFVMRAIVREGLHCKVGSKALKSFFAYRKKYQARIRAQREKALAKKRAAKRAYFGRPLTQSFADAFMEAIRRSA